MATVRVSYYGGAASEPAGVNAESGIRHSRDDAQSGSTAIPIPTSTGTNFSWIKQVALEVTGATSNNLSNFRIQLASALASGLTLGFLGSSTYVQPASGNKPADSGSNGAVPATYTAMTTSPQQWYAGPISSSTTGRKGDFCRLVLGVDYTYAGGANSNLSLPNLTISYDET